MSRKVIIAGTDRMDPAAETLAGFGVNAERVPPDPAHRAPGDIVLVENDQSGDRARSWSATGALVFAVPALGPPLESLASTLKDDPENPVATLAVGRSGPINAALAAVSVLANDDEALLERLEAFRAEQTRKVLATPDPSV